MKINCPKCNSDGKVIAGSACGECLDGKIEVSECDHCDGLGGQGYGYEDNRDPPTMCGWCEGTGQVDLFGNPVGPSKFKASMK